MQNKSTCHTTKQRLIDANELLEQIRTLSVTVTGLRSGKGVLNEFMKHYRESVLRIVDEAPTVDAIVLPCRIGDDVYIIPSKVNFDLNVLGRHKENNRVYHQKVANIVFTEDGWYMTGSADKEWGTGRILLDRFYKETWFLTKEEAETALAKMDGGNEDG